MVPPFACHIDRFPGIVHHTALTKDDGADTSPAMDLLRLGAQEQLVILAACDRLTPTGQPRVQRDPLRFQLESDARRPRDAARVEAQAVGEIDERVRTRAEVIGHARGSAHAGLERQVPAALERPANRTAQEDPVADTRARTQDRPPLRVRPTDDRDRQHQWPISASDVTAHQRATKPAGPLVASIKELVGVRVTVRERRGAEGIQGGARHGRDIRDVPRDRFACDQIRRRVIGIEVPPPDELIRRDEHLLRPDAHHRRVVARPDQHPRLLREPRRPAVDVFEQSALVHGYLVTEVRARRYASRMPADEPHHDALADDIGTVLAHVGDATPPPGFLQFWGKWSKRMEAIEPRFYEPDPDEAAGCGAGGVTHLFRSLDGVRVGCRITAPEDRSPTGVVVTLHGYAVDPDDELRVGRGLTERGLAVIDLRVRGYPGSQLDTGNLTQPEGYITRGLGDPDTWSIQQATSDVVNCLRAARAMFGPKAPCSLFGSSLGGGLAVLAASVGRDFVPLERLAVGLPTFGDWPWRERTGAFGGSGGEALRVLCEFPDRAEDIRTCLRLFDAVVHARRVAVPVLCKLALHDDVVPARSAASVYNALGTGPGEKFRFIVEAGHAPTEAMTMQDLRRHALFEKLADAFLDPSEDLTPLMGRLGNLLDPQQG